MPQLDIDTIRVMDQIITFCREILILEQLYIIKVTYKLNTWYKNINLENLI